ncbi:Small conductance calcium-activated potassium channel protein [Aphelenchoides besseyi]|nr:Small conductance calcium-activated potassium channel protein [Aphelenchoides besseyi]
MPNCNGNHRKRLSPKKQMSLKVSDYPILLLAHNHSNDGDGIKWTESDLPDSCVSGSSWVIGGETLKNSASQQERLTTMATEHRSVLWNGVETHTYYSRKRGSAASDGTRGFDDDFDGLSMLKPQPKYSLAVNPSSSTNNTQIPPARSPASSRRGRKQQLWSLSPAAFHQSFDDRLKSSDEGVLSNSCGNIEEQTREYGRRKRRAAFCSGDTSKGAFAGSYGARGTDSADLECKTCRRVFTFGSIETPDQGAVARMRSPSAAGAMSLHLQPPTRTASTLMLHPGEFVDRSPRRLSVNLGCSGVSSGARQPLGRSPQSSFDSNGDVGQISLNFLRCNGTMAPFKTLLTSTTSTSPATQTRAFVPIQQSALTRNQSGNLAQTAAATTPAIYGEFVKRKESLGRPRKQSDPRVSYEHVENLRVLFTNFTFYKLIGCVSCYCKALQSLSFLSSMHSSPPHRPTGFSRIEQPTNSSELYANGSASIRQGGSGRRRGPSSMLKQDSIAEECDSRTPSPCPPFGNVIASSTPANNSFPYLPQSRHPSTGSQISDSQPLSPRFARYNVLQTPERKGSLSPNAGPSSSHSLSNERASTRRRGFQRGPSLSTAQSDVTDAQTRPQVVFESQMHGCMSYENTSRIRFDICSSGGSSLRNSNSSTLFGRGLTGTTLPVPPAVVGSTGLGGLKANGFVPRTYSGMPRDPSRWHFSITKQRSQSESAFNMKSRQLGLPPGVDDISPTGSGRMAGGGSASLSGCPSHRRCSMTILNPHKEQAILRRILGPTALDWLKNIMMILENELTSAEVYDKGTMPSITLKLAIMLSTIILVCLVIKFHVHEVQLFMNSNSAEDWRIALTWRRCSRVALELLACGVCPLPIDIESTTTLVSLDVILSIPMFFRLYWICRVMLLHSRLFTDASSRSIAGLNRVNFNARFILKTLMTLCPGTMLLVFTASLWIIAGWILRQCERHHIGDPASSYRMAVKHQNYLNSLWMIAITFLSVGYGDIVPNTYCGRTVAVITGVLGTCTSSMVVAVIARKLELSRAELSVHNFMVDTQLTKKLKHSAANVLRETWLIYKHRRLVDKIDPVKIRHHQRKFLVAIYALRKVKRDQRKLAENSTTSNTYELIHDIHSTQEGLALRMTSVEHQLSDIQRELGGLSELLRNSFKRSSFSNSNYEPDHSPVESLRRRRDRPLVDVP